MITDQRRDFFLQVPAVRLHPAVLQTLGFPEFTLVTISLPGTRRRCAAWAVSAEGPEANWATCETPWHRAAQLSAAAWRVLLGDARPRSGEHVEIGFPVHRLSVRPARVERLLAGNELGLHRDDVARLGIRDWAFVNAGGVPGIFRVRTSRDRAIAA